MPYLKATISRAIRSAKPEVKFELSEKQKEVLENTTQVVMAVVLAAGAVTLFAAAPGIFRLLNQMRWAGRKFESGTKRKGLDKKEAAIRKSFYYLKSKGYVELIPKGEDFIIKVTQKGRKYQKKMAFDGLFVKSEKIWRGDWWVVLADIPQDYKSAANAFRLKIKQMGFYPLQRTVWFYPYDPRDEVDFVAAYYHIERFVTVLKASEIDPADEKVLKVWFRDKNIL